MSVLTKLNTIEDSKRHEISDLQNMMVTDISPINKNPSVQEGEMLSQENMIHTQQHSKSDLHDEQSPQASSPPDFQEIQGRIDHKLSSLTSKLDQLGMQFDLEKDGFDFFKTLQEENFQFFSKDHINKG